MYKLNGHKVLQYPGELEDLIAIFQTHDVRSYLEIGCKYGGSLWQIGGALPKGSRIVAVDLMRYAETNDHLYQVTSNLRGMGHAVSLIRGDSTNHNVIREVQKLSPFDACLIDGDHTLNGVNADWRNYGPMCKL